MNSKEALKKLSNDLGNYLPFQRKINIIKQDLDKLEELEKVMTILAKKAVNMMRFSLTLDDTNYYYNLGIKKKYQLNKKEYDLLKEYLGNESIL